MKSIKRYLLEALQDTAIMFVQASGAMKDHKDSIEAFVDELGNDCKGIFSINLNGVIKVDDVNQIDFRSGRLEDISLCTGVVNQMKPGKVYVACDTLWATQPDVVEEIKKFPCEVNLLVIDLDDAINSSNIAKAYSSVRTKVMVTRLY